MYTSALVRQALPPEASPKDVEGALPSGKQALGQGSTDRPSFTLSYAFQQSPPQICYLPLPFPPSHSQMCCSGVLWRPSQWLCPTFLVVFKGSCFSWCPGQDGLRECLEMPNTCMFDSVDRYILKCCNSQFLRQLFLGCTMLHFDLWQQ